MDGRRLDGRGAWMAFEASGGEADQSKWGLNQSNPLRSYPVCIIGQRAMPVSRGPA